jgi:quercetin dioxygenase-like cupin family protein
MRTTIFQLDQRGAVQPAVDEVPAFDAFETFDGRPLERVHLHQIATRGDIELQHVRIAAGGHFVMHSSPKLAFCHIIAGEGKLGLPDGRSLPYRGPETYVFLPDTLHDWHDVTVDTLLAVAIVPDAEVR